MLSMTLQGATLRAPYRGRSEMLRKAREYAASSKVLREQGEYNDADLHQELSIVHRALSKGKRLLSINKAMQIGGCKPNGHPTLAVANAAARWAWFVYDAGQTGNPRDMFDLYVAGFVSDFGINPGWTPQRKITAGKKNEIFRFNRQFFPTRMNEERIIARVPIIPPKLVPKGDLRKHTILWEADWRQAPKDPFLLKRITREWYEIIAEWDLTNIERIVLEMAAYAGE